MHPREVKSVYFLSVQTRVLVELLRLLFHHGYIHDASPSSLGETDVIFFHFIKGSKLDHVVESMRNVRVASVTNDLLCSIYLN